MTRSDDFVSGYIYGLRQMGIQSISLNPHSNHYSFGHVEDIISARKGSYIHGGEMYPRIKSVIISDNPVDYKRNQTFMYREIKRFISRFPFCFKNCYYIEPILEINGCFQTIDQPDFVKGFLKAFYNQGVRAVLFYDSFYALCKTESMQWVGKNRKKYFRKVATSTLMYNRVKELLNGEPGKACKLKANL